MGIIWLASYPKSGNTWARFLLYSALFGQPRASIDISRKIPDIHRPLPFDQPADGRLLVKSHFALGPKHPKLGLTERAILITRDPKDVLLSGLNYRRLAGMAPTAMPDAAYARDFIRHLGDPDWNEQGFGTWPSHAQSWLTNTSFPVLRIRYEDLHADTAAALRQLLAFVGIDRSDAAIQSAVAAASFESMRAMELQEKTDPSRRDERTRLFIGRHLNTSASADTAAKPTLFMNAGRVGQTLDAIEPGLDAEFDNAFRSAQAELGY